MCLWDPEWPIPTHYQIPLEFKVGENGLIWSLGTVVQDITVEPFGRAITTKGNAFAACTLNGTTYQWNPWDCSLRVLRRIE